MPGTWPPPPDMESIQELVVAADIEGYIADGAPADEYESEAEAIFGAIQHFSTTEITAEQLTPVIEKVWSISFSLGEPMLTERRAGISGLAQQIARFFGPEAKPQVRGS